MTLKRGYTPVLRIIQRWRKNTVLAAGTTSRRGTRLSSMTIIPISE